jgi:hypothetical protein
MKRRLFFALAFVAVLLPFAGRPQDAAPARPAPQQLREELRSLPPEERQARLRELRGQFGPPPAAAANRSGADLDRIYRVLTPEQRASARAASQADAAPMRELETKLRDARKAALDAALDRPFDETTLRQKLESAAKLEVDWMVLRARSLSKIKPPLTAEQIDQIKNPPPTGMLPPQPALTTPALESAPPKPPDVPRDENDLPLPAKP